MSEKVATFVQPDGTCSPNAYSPEIKIFSNGPKLVLSGNCPCCQILIYTKVYTENQKKEYSVMGLCQRCQRIQKIPDLTITIKKT